MSEMNWQECHEVMKRLRALFGFDSRCEVTVNDGGIGGYISINTMYEFFRGKTVAEVVANMETWAEAKAADIAAKQTRKMALKIIDITGDGGACSAASLRLLGFSDLDIERFGPAACEEANRLASNGPFTITPVPSNQIDAAA